MCWKLSFAPYLYQIVTCIIDGLKGFLGLRSTFAREFARQEPQCRHEEAGRDQGCQSPEGRVGVVKHRLGCFDERNVSGGLLCVEVNPVTEEGIQQCMLEQPKHAIVFGCHYNIDEMLN